MDQIIIAQEEPRIASILVEVPIDAGVQKVAFPNVQQLLNTTDQVIVIKSIRCLTAKVLAGGVLTAAANMPLVDLQSAVATFYCQGWQKGRNIPLLLLNDMADGDNTAATTIPYKNSPPTFANWYNLDWTQSEIQYINGVTASVTGVFLFDVQYIKVRGAAFRNGQIEEIIGPS